MNENTIGGAAQSGAGRVQSSLGEAFDSLELKGEGLANRAKGGVRQAAGKLQARIESATERLSDTVGMAAEQGQAAYQRTAEETRKLAGRIEPMVRERPLAATGLALGAGVLIGLLLAGRTAPKVIYVKPPV